MALGDLRERPVRDPVPVREASPFQKTDVASEPIDQLGEKAALPHAGLTVERDELRRTLVRHALGERQEHTHLRVAPYEGRRETLDPAPGGP